MTRTAKQVRERLKREFIPVDFHIWTLKVYSDEAMQRAEQLRIIKRMKK